MDFLGGSDGEVSVCNVGDPASIPGLGRFSGKGNGNPFPFLPGKSHGQRSLAGYNPWGHKRKNLATKRQQMYIMESNRSRHIHEY